jgi:hypothetical protein
MKAIIAIRITRKAIIMAASPVEEYMVMAPKVHSDLRHRG